MTSSKMYFSESQHELVTSILNRIVPSDGKMPGAGEVALGYLDRVVGSRNDYRQLFGRGLSQIEIAAQSKHGKDFVELSNDEKDSVLRQVEASETRFFDALVRQTYNGYYTNPQVIGLLGLEARPPQPRGHQLDRGDLSFMENVRKRGIVYRETGDKGLG
jgi:hypothetical protein